MIKKDMNLTEEQRGMVKQDSGVEGTSALGGDDHKKSVDEKDDVKSLQVIIYYYYYYYLVNLVKVMYVMSSFVPRPKN